MKSLHIKLDKTPPPLKWADAQADRIGARGHVGTHLDCYTTVPEKSEYNITAMVLDCQNGMPKLDNIKSFTTLENMALLLHTANLEKNEYGTDMYFATDTFLCEEVLHSILEKKPLFIIIDSHGIAEKGKRHIEFDKVCEANGCHVIENVDFSCIGKQKNIQLKILINIDHKSTGKPCELYCM